jgi:hypothetical protein
MILASRSHNAYQSHRAARTPDSQQSEFPQRKTTPGPDDVYDPDYSPRHSGNDSYDWGSGGGGAQSDVLF